MKTTEAVQHTPGPWTATDPHKWLADTPRFKCSIRYGSGNLGNSIAEVYLGGNGALRCDAESVNANARLIASAPDLLETAQAVHTEIVGLLAFLETCSTDVIVESLPSLIANLERKRSLLEAAISRAKGEGQ